MKTPSFFRIAFGMIALACAPLIALSPAAAYAAPEKAAPSFSIKIDGGKAIVSDASGKAVGSFPSGTVGKTLNVGGTSFQLGFSKGPDGNLLLTVAPLQGSTSSLNFTINGRSVEVAPPGLGSPSAPVVSVNIASSGQTTISSTGGAVKVDGKPAAPATVTSISTSPGGAGTGGGSPDLSDLTVIPREEAVQTQASTQSQNVRDVGFNGSFNSPDTSPQPNTNAQSVRIATSPNPTTPF